MPKATFHNIGNGDRIRIDLSNGKKILFDYADQRDPNDEDDLRCDLPGELRQDLGDRKNYDLVAFTHLDKDHYSGATEFFYFNHIQKYQGNVNGKPRIKMDIMWVPAAVITEPISQDASKEAKAIQKEARERFKDKKGIRVFSRPSRLKQWCEDNEVDLDERKHLVTDAGRCTPEFSLANDGVEFFVHSPFAKRQDENNVEHRNADSLIMHATFSVDGEKTRLYLASDAEHDVLADIVDITEGKNNAQRLEWDIFKLPHHCSHRALTGDERKGDKSGPRSEVARLFEDYTNDRCIVVSTSEPIPGKGSEADKQKGANPPHRQAANYYREDVTEPNKGEFKATIVEAPVGWTLD